MNTITLKDLSSQLDAATCDCLDQDDCTGYCDLSILGLAYDALASFPSGVVVKRETVSQVFGAPFGRLTAWLDGDFVAEVKHFQNIGEGLYDLLNDVNATDYERLVYEEENRLTASAIVVNGTVVGFTRHINI